MSADGAGVLLLWQVQPYCKALLRLGLGLRQAVRPAPLLRHPRLRTALPPGRLRVMRQDEHPELCMWAH
jgi:hypothetical protein